MSLEFGWLINENGSESIVLEDSSVEKLSHAFDELKSKTGLKIDWYGDTRISPGHARLLCEYICEQNLLKSKDLDRLYRVLEKAVKESRWILVVGD